MRGVSVMIGNTVITASVVLYNTDIALVENVINSYGPSDKRILYIIDNSERMICRYQNRANIQYIFNNRNMGYGAAHNIGIKKSIELGARYHIVLNPDVSFEPKIIDELIRYSNLNLDVVYMLPKVLYPSGELQYLCKLLPTPFDLIFRRFLPEIGFLKKRNDKYTLKNTGYDKIMNPPCLSGCFMFMRTKTLEENKLFFDERFFMYCEDFDLMRRLHRFGKTIFYPSVSIIHNHTKESYKSNKMLFQHIKSACIYFNKYGWFYDLERFETNKLTLQENLFL